MGSIKYLKSGEGAGSATVPAVLSDKEWRVISERPVISESVNSNQKKARDQGEAGELGIGQTRHISGA